jgi:hypothetical protein
VRIELSEPVKRTGRVMQVEGMFDVPPSERQAYLLEVPDDFTRVAEDPEAWDIAGRWR